MPKKTKTIVVELRGYDLARVLVEEGKEVVTMTIRGKTHVDVLDSHPPTTVGCMYDLNLDTGEVEWSILDTAVSTPADDAYFSQRLRAVLQRLGLAAK